MGPDEMLKRLKEWPRGLNLDQRKTVREALKACCAIFEAPRALLAWEEHEEPWLIVASLADTGFMWIEEKPDRYLPLVDPEHEADAFEGEASSREEGMLVNSGKWLASEASFFACDTAFQTFGGYSFAREYHVGRYWAQSRLGRVAPVSNQLVLSYVSETILGMPRSY